MTETVHLEFDGPAATLAEETSNAAGDGKTVGIETRASTVCELAQEGQVYGSRAAPGVPTHRVRRSNGSGVNMSKSAKFWDKIAERYSKRPVADEVSYQKKLKITREYFRPDMEVLEFGCGTGSTAIVHAPYVKHIRAIDISSKMIEIARRKAETAHIENITFEKATIDDLCAHDHTLDAVLGLSILHLLEDKEAVIAKVHKMLKPGGVFVTSTPCLGDTQSYVKWILPIGRLLGIMPPVKIFTMKALEDSLTTSSVKLDCQWQPGKGKAVFIVAKKTERV